MTFSRFSMDIFVLVQVGRLLLTRFEDDEKALIFKICLNFKTSVFESRGAERTSIVAPLCLTEYFHAMLT